MFKYLFNFYPLFIWAFFFGLIFFSIIVIGKTIKKWNVSSISSLLFGLIVADYYLIKNQELSNKDLYSIDKESVYYYSGGWHIKGVYSLILGFIFSASTIWNTNLMFLQSYAWIIGAFVAWITYYLLAKK